MEHIMIPISCGELIDKITILEIKSQKITDSDKLKNVHQELDELNRAWLALEPSNVDINDLRQQLRAVNESLWNIEDDIRKKDLRGEFDNEYIELARSVYFKNDARAEHKRAINLRLGSKLIEEKCYVDYQAGEGNNGVQPTTEGSQA